MNFLNDKYNREYTLKLNFLNRDCELSVFFNKNNLYTAFSLDQATYEKNKKKSNSSIIFFDLNKSLFAKTFLDLKNFNTNNIDIKNQYNSIFSQHRDIVSREFYEYIVLDTTKVSWHNQLQDNSIKLNIFRLSLYEPDFLFLLCERQLIDPVLGKKIIRTSGYQLSNDNAIKYINSISSKYNTSVVKKQTTEAVMRSVFEDEKKSNNKKIERCGIL